MICGAVMSECGNYRYALTRNWNSAKPMIVWMMLNPSTADTNQDDPTIRKCVGFTRRMGGGQLAVVNLFAWRATNPKEMLCAEDPVGPENDAHISDACWGRKVIVAWGATTRAKAIRHRAHAISRLLSNVDVQALRLTQKGDPMHPLYIPYDALDSPVRWVCG